MRTFEITITVYKIKTASFFFTSEKSKSFHQTIDTIQYFKYAFKYFFVVSKKDVLFICLITTIQHNTRLVVEK